MKKIRTFHNLSLKQFKIALREVNKYLYEIKYKFNKFNASINTIFAHEANSPIKHETKLNN